VDGGEDPNKQHVALDARASRAAPRSMVLLEGGWTMQKEFPSVLTRVEAEQGREHGRPAFESPSWSLAEEFVS
jgi:hypothetical protein